MERLPLSKGFAYFPADDFSQLKTWRLRSGVAKDMNTPTFACAIHTIELQKQVEILVSEVVAERGNFPFSGLRNFQCEVWFCGDVADLVLGENGGE